MYKLLLFYFLVLLQPTAEAQKQSGRLAVELNTATSKEGKSLALQKLAKAYRDTNPNALKLYAEELIMVSEGDSASLSFAWGHYYLGDYYYLTDQNEFAIKYFDQSFLSFNRTYDLEGIGEASYSLANIYFQIDRYRNALSYAQTALDAFYKTGTLIKQANSLSLICDIYTYMERYNQAIQYCVQSMSIKEDIGIEVGKEVTLNTIGLIYQELGTYNKSKQYLKLALALAHKNEDAYNIATTYSNLGNLYILLESYDSAEIYFEKAMAIDEIQEDASGLAYSYFDLGNLYSLTGKPELAKEQLLKASSIAGEQQMPELEAKIGIALAETYSAQKDYQKAINELKASLVIAQRINSSIILRDVYQNLSKAYDRLNDKDNALVYMRLYILAAERKYKTDNARAIAEIETIYGIEGKEKEIKLLQKEKAIEILKADQRKFLIVSAAIGVLFLLILLTILYSRNRLKNKVNDRLRQKHYEIIEQKEEIESQKEELQLNGNILAAKNEHITDSIRYAKQIQESLLPARSLLNQILPQSFIYYKPKDIVSGDFYWHAQIDDKIAVAVIDCTGHGVPGAFMTVLANTLLNQIILETGIHSPDLVISLLDQKIQQTLHQKHLGTSNMDGLDIGLLIINKATKELTFAGAKIPLYIIIDGQLQTIKGDRYSAGSAHFQQKIFSKQNIPLTSGSMLYLSSDGYQDQFGGPHDKKFMKQNFYDFLKSISYLPPREQEHSLESQFQRWRGNTPQTDDILIIGIKV
jgi:serine phosphatase RsbU (regulator of sigma subunit)